MPTTAFSRTARILIPIAIVAILALVVSYRDTSASHIAGGQFSPVVDLELCNALADTFPGPSTLMALMTGPRKPRRRRGATD